MSQLSETLSALASVGSVRDVRDLASAGYAPASRPKVNAHIHLPPNFSAFTTVAQAVDLAAAQGVTVLGVSNYYDYNVYGDFGALARTKGVYPLFGLEIICMLDDLKAAGVKINDPGNPGKMYLCGKALSHIADMTPTGTRLLAKFRDNDVARVDKMIAATEKVFADRGLPTGLTTAKVVDMVVTRHGSPRHTVYLQERHVAQAFQEAAFAATAPGERLDRLSAVFGTRTSAKSPDDAVAVQNDLRSHLLKAGKPAYVTENFVSFDEAYNLVTALGGVPVYPILADGAPSIQPFEGPVDTLITNLRRRNIHAAEFIPNRNDVTVLTNYAKALRAAGIVLTAGTEHNTLDLIGIEPVCKKDVPIPDDVKAIFWEGACVMAAHQFLTLNGEPGFVDGAGRPNPAYPEAEARIAAFARLGAAIIRKYSEGSK